MDELKGFPLLNADSIQLNCDRGAAQRGKKYQLQGRVFDLQWRPGFRMLHARVRGSGSNIYRQHIDMTNYDGFGDIDGDCSCPVNFNCKHVAAILYECLERQDASISGTEEAGAGVNAEDQLQRWQQTMRGLQQASQPRIPSPAQKEHILYILSQHPRDTSLLVLNVQRRRRLKAGGWGRLAAVHIEHIADTYRRPAYANEIDQHIAELMQRTESAYYLNYDNYPIKGGDGFLLLKTLLLSGRCYWQDVDNPVLRRGGDKTAEFKWLLEEGKHRLKISLHDSSDNWLCLATEPPYYLDVASSRCGEIRQSFSGAELAHLHQLPALSDDELEQFSRYVLHELPHGDLPAPLDLGVRFFDGPPQGVASIITEQKEGRNMHFLQLQMRYGDCLFDPLDDDILDFSSQPSMLVGAKDESDNEWRVQRQPALELALIQCLRQSGLQPVEVNKETSSSPYSQWFFTSVSRAENARLWNEFLQHQVPLLEQQLWQFVIDVSFDLTVSDSMDFSGQLSGQGDWFGIGLDIKIGRKKVALLPLVLQWISENSLREQQEILVEHSPNQWVKLSRQLVQPIVDTLVELHAGNNLDEQGVLRLPRQHAERVLSLQEQLQTIESAFNWSGGKRIQALAEKLRDFNGIATVAVPKQLKAQLRDYQQQGVNWLDFLADHQFGGILADDMGLGKTLQTLAHILSQKEKGKLKHPVLIVAPTSVLSNWEREVKRFTPSLTFAVSHGHKRKAIHQAGADYDILITSYSLLVRDKHWLEAQSWQTVVLDEAQVIKNPNAQTAQVARSLNAFSRLCLTGTPMENHLGELWSLFHFLMPDFLGSQARFNVVFRKPIEREGDTVSQSRLNQRIQPFMLRRDKNQVATELPAKTEIIRTVSLPQKQARLYETVRITVEKKVRKILKAKGMASSHIEMLDALLKLRQVCCDPRLLKIASASEVDQSAKLELLMEMLPELLEEGRRILIFSQFTSMLGLIEAELTLQKISYSKLTGQTRKRDDAIAKFQDGKVPVFLISLKAGGVGLNLTAADTVIHYDPWWNPAAENQATDRAYRIGQDKPVFVYKLIAEKTVEEKIIELQKKKRALADAVYAGGKQQKSNLETDELLSLFDRI